MSIMKEDKEARYVLVDALRGVAALMVVFHHMLHNSVMEVTLRQTLPAFLLSLSDYGAFGVQIFFVLSGFVIAHSLRNNPLTVQSIGNFILRRQLRLDPPYWVMLAFALLVHAAEKKAFPFTTPPMPHSKEVLLNMFYLQNITGSTQIISLAWTLCLEVQFYLVFILLLGLGQKTLRGAHETQIIMPTLLLLFGSGVGSLVYNLESGNSPWFIKHWFYFVAGVLCYWSVKRQLRPSFLYAYMGAFALLIRS